MISKNNIPNIKYELWMHSLCSFPEYKMPKITNCCFTYNLAADIEVPSDEDCQVMFKPDSKVKYWVMQLERGESNGRLHLQGFLQCTSSSLGELKSYFPTKAVHIESAKSAELVKARDYCKKPDTRVSGPWEWGEFRERAAPGKRSDLDTVVEKLRSGTPLTTVAEEHGSTYVRNYRGLAALDGIINPPRKRQNVAPNVWVYSGVTGSGKSRRARHLCGQRVYVKTEDPWWCGYNGRDHDFVLFEEFEGPEWMPPAVLLSLVDRYTRDVPKKGVSSYPFSCSNFVFTSNNRVEDWYKGTKYAALWYDWDFEKNEIKASSKCRAFLRRIDEAGEGGIFHYDEHWDDQTDEEHDRGLFTVVKKEVIEID